jgi:hypothetical protein
MQFFAQLNAEIIWKIFLYCGINTSMAFLMYHSTQPFYNKQISTTVLAFVYYREELLHVSHMSGHRQTIII